MKQNQFPEGWDEARVRQVLSVYERQSEEEALAEDETYKPVWNYDLFLSFASADRDQARRIVERADALHLRTFTAPRTHLTGDVWSEEIRKALVSSREVAILITPDNLRSEWLATEWGAAWVLRKRITPILLRCSPEDLPDRLRQHHALDFHNFEAYLTELRTRAAA